MRIVARIQHHPSRAELLPALVESLAPLPVEVCSHGSIPPCPWVGYQLALADGLNDPTNPTHVLVLQDDVIVSENFTTVLGKIARATAGDPVSFFLARLPAGASAQVYPALKNHERYVRALPGDKFFPALGILWPRQAAQDLFAWIDSGVKLPGYPNQACSDDAVFGEWIRRLQRTAWYTVPSLVEHPDEVESTIGKTAQWGRDRNRKALVFCDGDARAYDW